MSMNPVQENSCLQWVTNNPISACVIQLASKVQTFAADLFYMLCYFARPNMRAVPSDLYDTMMLIDKTLVATDIEYRKDNSMDLKLPFPYLYMIQFTIACGSQILCISNQEFRSLESNQEDPTLESNKKDPISEFKQGDFSLNSILEELSLEMNQADLALESNQADPLLEPNPAYPSLEEFEEQFSRNITYANQARSWQVHTGLFKKDYQSGDLKETLVPLELPSWLHAVK